MLIVIRLTLLACVCSCTLREDLLAEMIVLADQGRFDYLVVESSGISEPLPVAEVRELAELHALFERQLESFTWRLRHTHLSICLSGDKHVPGGSMRLNRL